jgi:hypothetical protein
MLTRDDDAPDRGTGADPFPDAYGADMASRSGATILIVDDDPVFRSLIHHAPADAILTVASERPDLCGPAFPTASTESHFGRFQNPPDRGAGKRVPFESLHAGSTRRRKGRGPNCRWPPRLALVRNRSKF